MLLDLKKTSLFRLWSAGVVLGSVVMSAFSCHMFLRVASTMPLLCTLYSNIGKLLVCKVWYTDNRGISAFPFLLFVLFCFAKLLSLRVVA